MTPINDMNRDQRNMLSVKDFSGNADNNKHCMKNDMLSIYQGAYNSFDV
jgi:hypothetical protein